VSVLDYVTNFSRLAVLQEAIGTCAIGSIKSVYMSYLLEQIMSVNITLDNLHDIVELRLTPLTRPRLQIISPLRASKY
jgi:hypothetical protein